MNGSILDNVIRYLEVSSATVKRAMDEVATRRAAQEKAAGLIPQVLKYMLDTQVLPREQEKAAEVMLGAHDTTLSLLQSATEKIAELTAENARLAKATAEKRAGDVGRAVGDARPSDATANSLNSVYVGTKTAEVKESDKPLLRLIGK